MPNDDQPGFLPTRATNDIYPGRGGRWDHFTDTEISELIDALRAQLARAEEGAPLLQIEAVGKLLVELLMYEGDQWTHDANRADVLLNARRARGAHAE
jgi:hypothetical protein